MPARTKFTEAEILDAALTVVDECGLDGAAISEIAKRLRAPSGSIYHRFASRKHLLGALWIRIVNEYREHLERAIAVPRRQLPTSIVRSTFAWVRVNPLRARLLMRLRTEDFAPGDWPAEVIGEIEKCNSAIASQIAALAMKLEANPIDVMLAVIDIPAAVARRQLLLGDETADARLEQQAIRLVRQLLSP